MSSADKPEATPTLASLRRRGTPRRTALQPEFFGNLFAVGQLSEETSSEDLTPPAVRIDRPLEAPPGRPYDSSGSPSVELPKVAVPSANVATTSSVAVAAYAAREEPYPSAPEPEPDAPPRTWTVSGLVRHVRELVERGYAQITVEGEISNWRPAGSGHCYFTVKDTGAQLSAVLFRRQASLLRFRPSDGDAVRLHGQLSLYESRGQMQLIVEWMDQPT